MAHRQTSPFSTSELVLQLDGKCNRDEVQIVMIELEGPRSRIVNSSATADEGLYEGSLADCTDAWETCQFFKLIYY